MPATQRKKGYKVNLIFIIFSFYAINITSKVTYNKNSSVLTDNLKTTQVGAEADTGLKYLRSVFLAQNAANAGEIQ